MILMSKLFLSSMSVNGPEQTRAFLEWAGKDPQDIRMALIENAADVEDGDKQWVIDQRAALARVAGKLTIVDLTAYTENNQGLRDLLAAQDVIWLGGGNTYYLRWLLAETEADGMIKDLTAAGMRYGGGSAGAIIAGPTISGFEPVDDPNGAPQVILGGLHLTDIVILPHAESKDFGSGMIEVTENVARAGFETRALTDSQALVIDGDQQRLIG